MKINVSGKPVFSYVDIDLEPGESFICESDAMASMSADLDMTAKFNGGLLSGLLKKFLGKESLFISVFTNNTNEVKRLTITQSNPGDIIVKDLVNESYNIQPGGYIASSPDIKLGLKWAGFASWIGGEGLFKLVVSGNGNVVFGAYGGLVEKHVNGEYIVDTDHLVAYEPQMKLKVQLAGGLFSSFFGGEGLVTRVEGNGKIILQTRTLSGLAKWINKYLK
jgi:uncharacterized protein (TIGR00266 family)